MIFREYNKYSNFYGIYIIKNIKTNKVYVGQTKQKFKKRYWAHLWALRNGIHFNKKLQSSYNKYGEDFFEFQIVEIIDNPDCLDEKEKEYIQKFDSISNGYNISEGGKDIDFSKYISPNIRKEVGQKNSKRMLGRQLSEETKKRMRESSRHLSPSPETIEAVRNYMKNRKVQEETRDKLRKANTGENSPVTKFTNEDVSKIKEMINNGVQVKKIAEKYCVSYGAISAIKHNRQWKHIKPEIKISYDNTVPSQK